MMSASKKILSSKASKSVVINFGSGDLYQGFSSVTAQLRMGSQNFPEQFTGSLPPAPELAEIYQDWQLVYQELFNGLRVSSRSKYKDDDIIIDEIGITHVCEIDLNELCERFQENLNAWLKSEKFLKVDRQLRSRLDSSEEILVIIETNDDLLRRLPWHRWDFFQDYLYSEIALSKTEYKRPRAFAPREKVRILAILGNSKDIDLDTEIQLLQNLKDAQSEFLIKPSRREFNERLWDRQGWDILFFAGHSQTKGTKGQIYINENEINNSLTLDELEEALKAAIENGLKLAIFNSCDGLGLADTLTGLNIPQVIVMREPVPNRVAQEFFRHFIEAFAEQQQPLYLAAQQARRKLQGLEDKYPGASWLPVICQNPAVEPLTWQALINKIPPCPYRGLSAFCEEDAPLFFGREEFANKLLGAVKHKPLVAVIGASGSGKSSVVFAGLIPQLQAIGGVQIIPFRPQNKPFASLAVALRSLEDTEISTTLFETLNCIVESNPNKCLVLVADQFEELYTLCPPDERQVFLDELLRAVNEVPNFSLVMTMRADFYDAALSYRPFSDALQDATYNLGPMNKEELHRAIAQPAAIEGVSLENGLIHRLIAAVAGKPGRLPLLEFTLTQLWAKQQDGWLTHQSYEEIGGVEKALANHAEATYTQLNKEERELAKRVFIQLVHLGEGTEATRRVATREQVKNWDLVTKLASARLVVTGNKKVSDRGKEREKFAKNNSDETVEIIHEALISAWERLRTWLRESEDFLRWQYRLENAIHQWQTHQRLEGYLLSEAPLVEAEDWLHKRQDELSSSQLNFISQSIKLRDEKIKQEKHRRRLTFSLLTGSLAAVSLWAGVAWWQWQKLVINEIQALTQSSKAFSSSYQNIDALIASVKANKNLLRAIWIPDTIRTQAIKQLSMVFSEIQEQNRLEGHENWLWAVSFSPDGQTLASGSRDNTVKLWKRDGSLLHTFKGHTDTVKRISFSPDGQTLVSAGQDLSIKLWRIKDGALLYTLRGHNDEVDEVTFSPDGQTIASASYDGTIKLWQAKNGSLLHTLSDVYSISFSPDSQTIASSGGDNTIKMWRTKDGTVFHTFKGNDYGGSVVRFSPDGQTIATAVGEDIKLWRKSDGSLLQILKGHSASILDLNFSLDGQTIASASVDHTVKLWRSKDGIELQTFQGHGARVTGVSFSPDGKTIASASADRTIRLWRKRNTYLLHTFKGHSGRVSGVSFSPDGKTIVSASTDRSLKLWLTADGSLLQTLMGHNGGVYGVNFSPDGQTIASGSSDRTVKLWRTKDGALLRTFQGHNNDVYSISFSPYGQIIASGSLDHTVKLWQTKDGSLLHTLKGHNDDVFDLTFSPDGQTLVSGSSDRTVKLWRTKDGSLLRTLDHLAEVYAVSFSPDGQIIASGGEDNAIKLWRKSDGRLLKTLKGHTSWINDLSFSPDGQIIASTAQDTTIKLWNLQGEQLVENLGLDSYLSSSIGFSPDGQTLVSGGWDNTVKLWSLSNLPKQPERLNVAEQTEEINRLIENSCNWLHDYLMTNPNLSKQERQLCL